MDTYTIAEAAQLVGTSRGKLYQAIRTGQLRTAPGGEADQAMTVTRAALRAAGFPVPEPEAPGTPHATGPGPPPGPATPGPTAAGLPDRERQSDQGDRALIAHLERALAEAREREQRLLDLVAHLTGQRSALPAGAPPAAPPPSAVRPAAAARPPLSGVRQQIVAVVRQYPEGLSPQAARTLLHVDKDLRATMKGMVRSGILTRRAAGQYVVAPGW
jgi:hypothetical protein